MKNRYIEEYINLCSKLVYDCNECKNKTKIKSHNIAARKLIKLSKEINSDERLSKEVFKELLENKDEVVRLWSSIQCIDNNIYQEKAMELLNNLYKNSKNKIISFEARLKLKDLYKK